MSRDDLDLLKVALGVLVSIAGVGAGVWRYGINPARAYLERRRERNQALAALITEVAPLVREISPLVLKMAPILDRVAQEVLPNGGGSIADRVDEIRSQLMVTHRQRDQALFAARMASARTDQLGLITDVSRALQKQTGRAPDDLTGKGWLNCIDEIESAKVRRGFFSAVEDRRDYEFIFAWRRPIARGASEFVPVRFVAWPINDESKRYLGYVLNFTEVEDAAWPMDKPEDE